jgi:hypothetical protein
MNVEGVDPVKDSVLCSADWLQVILGWLLGMLSTPVVLFITRFFWGPKLQLSWSDCEPYIVSTQEQVPHTYATKLSDNLVRDVAFIRIRATNVKPRTASKCQAWLINAAKYDIENNELLGTFRDTMPLIWSYYPSNTAVDIPKGVDRYIDLLKIYRDEPAVIPQIRADDGSTIMPCCYQHLFTSFGSYEFKVLLTAEEMEPTSIIIFVKYLSLNSFKVSVRS